MSRVVIIGAGHAGGTVAALLRQYGHDAEILLVGEEVVPPYQRPPLSKGYLKGEIGVKALVLKSASFYAQHDIQLQLGRRAAQIDRQSKRLVFDNGTETHYDVLIIATGSRARGL